MFFAKPGEFEECGIFTIKHLILIIMTIIGIVISIKKTVHKNKEEVKEIIKKATTILWVLELIKILYIFCIGKVQNINEYVPLYYCSLVLYAGLMSSYGKGKVERAGDVFLSTGGIIGGIIFIIFPTTSLPTYPMFHFLSIHSFFFHGIMVYLGLLMNIINYIELKIKDIWYFSGLIGIICAIAFVMNNLFDSNLMFISKDFPGTPLTILYHLTGKFFTPIMIIIQMTLPFLIVYGIINLHKSIDKVDIKYYNK